MICITASQTEVSTSGRKEWTKMFCSVNARRSTIRQFSGPRLANKCLKEKKCKLYEFNDFFPGIELFSDICNLVWVVRKVSYLVKLHLKLQVVALHFLEVGM